MRKTTMTLAAAALLLTAGVGGPAGPAVAGAEDRAAAAASTAGAAPARATPAEIERTVIVLTNARRVAHGCRPLELRKPLRTAARRHTNRMAAVGVPRGLDHQLPGEPDLGTRATRAGYRGWTMLAENIAYGYETPADVVRGWMNSPGHRANILNCRLRHIGVGVAYGDGVRWWTQDFGRK